jgi:hypothetical protein
MQQFQDDDRVSLRPVHNQCRVQRVIRILSQHS